MRSMHIDQIEVRRISCSVPCDPRTVQRELAAPGSVRGIVGERLRAVLAQYRAEASKGPAGGDAA